MKLVDSFAELFACLLEVFGSEGDYQGYDYQQLRDRIESLFAEQLKVSSGMGLDDHYIQSARFAVVSYIDELVLSSDWEGRSQWKSDLMQRDIYNTSQGGIEFFENLQKLNSFNPVEREVREVYFYCLSMGFKGQYYRPEDEATLIGLVDSNLDVLAEDTSGCLYPLAYEKVVAEGVLPTSPVDWRPVWVATPILTVVALYLFYKAEIYMLLQQLVVEL